MLDYIVKPLHKIDKIFPPLGAKAHQEEKQGRAPRVEAKHLFFNNTTIPN